MYIKSNEFGAANISEIHELSEGKIYVHCTACISIFAEFLSWANHKGNAERLVQTPEEADHVVVLGCQVTDLAILNNMQHMEKLQATTKHKAKYWLGGCAAQRFDIPQPANSERLDIVRVNNTPIKNTKLITWAKPFWVKDFRPITGISEGNLFRDMYPMRVGVGCKEKCEHCTVRVVRGESHTLPIPAGEFTKYNNIVAIAENISVDQINALGTLALEQKKPISFRNVEPHIVIEASSMLYNLAFEQLLQVLHTPVQSSNPETLKAMHRRVAHTEGAIVFAQRLKDLGTITATNVIIDYNDYPNPNMKKLGEAFDYISWNPYWDGIWDRKKAEKRFTAYL